MKDEGCRDDVERNKKIFDDGVSSVDVLPNVEGIVSVIS